MTPALRDKVNTMRTEAKRQITNLVTAAFGFVAALAWNDAIKAMITTFIGIAPETKAKKINVYSSLAII